MTPRTVEPRIRSFLEDLSTLIGRAQKQVDLAAAALEGALEDLNISFYMQLRAVQDELTNQVALVTAELNDTTEKANTAIDKIAHLERMVEDLYSRVDTDGEDIARLEGKVAKQRYPI